MSRRRAPISFAVLGLRLVSRSARRPSARRPGPADPEHHPAEDLRRAFAITRRRPAPPCGVDAVLQQPRRLRPAKKVESLDTIVGESGRKVVVQDNYRNLVFFLRKGVKWHDGQPFTSKDVKHTFDMVREAPDAAAKLRINPRKDWYANVQAIETPDASTVVFHLKRPAALHPHDARLGLQPDLRRPRGGRELPDELRGHGPFKLKEWRKGEFVEYVKNPDYFVKGGLPRRPQVRRHRRARTRTAATAVRAVDVSFPGETSKTQSEQLKKAVPQLVVTPVSENVEQQRHHEHQEAAFDNLKIRLAVSHAIDRRALIQAVYQGGGVVGAPWRQAHAFWGLAEKDLAALPGYGHAARTSAGKKMMAEVGYARGQAAQGRDGDPRHPDLRGHGVVRHQRAEADRHRGHAQADRDAQWACHGRARRVPDRANLTGLGADDPERQLLREHTRATRRAITPITAASRHEADRPAVAGDRPEKRLQMVYAIQKKLEEDAARPILSWRIDYFTHWPHVKGLSSRTTCTTSAACRRSGGQVAE